MYTYLNYMLLSLRLSVFLSGSFTNMIGCPFKVLLQSLNTAVKTELLHENVIEWMQANGYPHSMNVLNSNDKNRHFFYSMHYYFPMTCIIKHFNMTDLQDTIIMGKGCPLFGPIALKCTLAPKKRITTNNYIFITLYIFK